MEKFKCLDCDNVFIIDLEENMDNIEFVNFCPFCGEESIVKYIDSEYD